jgi:hypothetical protein
MLDAAKTGQTVDVTAAAPAPPSPPGQYQNGGCNANPKAQNVTVTGAWVGDVKCHICTGWRFDHVSVTSGSLNMLGGANWIIDGGTFDGGARGGNYVIDVAPVDETYTGMDQPHDWTIRGVTVRNPGCSPNQQNWAHALYIDGKNGIPLHGIVENSTFSGRGCAAVVKIGGTGNYGASKRSPDAADFVTLRGSTVTVTDSSGAEPQAVLVATDSDGVTITDNHLVSPKFAVYLAGPFSGEGLKVTDNKISAPQFLLAQVWNIPSLAPIGAGGTKFLTYASPTSSCGEVGVCTGNSA